ncbi:MAG: HypC/HybG/HupF family hydrogenase formation chaperone [Planctomycetota bacterium]|jgi:hydrogenase expression/formation protein HypC
MCWAVPTRIVEVDGDVGKVELSGTVREVGLQLTPDAQVGDYVLIHAGFAIQRVDEEEAQKTLALLEEMFGSMERPDEAR